jgi:DNA-binding MarR family transcriptional regulator
MDAGAPAFALRLAPQFFSSVPLQAGLHACLASPARTFMHYDAKNYSMDLNVGRLVAKIHLQFRRCLDAELAKSEMGFTSSQWVVLMNLGFGNAQQTAAELASLLHQDTGAMTRMLDRLQAKGLVKRSRSNTDRRVVHVELSEAGRRLLPQLPKVSATVLNRILADFSAKEVQQLTKLLSRVLDSATACAQGSK